MKSYRVWVSGYADIPANSVEDAEAIASKCITMVSPEVSWKERTFVCVSGPSAGLKTEENDFGS